MILPNREMTWEVLIMRLHKFLISSTGTLLGNSAHRRLGTRMPVSLLCQRIAQRAKRDDAEEGKFWQSRYRSVLLVGEEVILAAAFWIT